VDDETETYWDHITGEAVHGPLKGKQLEVFGVEVTSVEAALRGEPDLTVSFSHPGGWKYWVMMLMWPLIKRGWFPPGFHDTMSEPDPRLEPLEIGLGVVVGDEAFFFPRSVVTSGPVETDLGGERIRVAVDPDDGVLAATLRDGSRPFQLQSRWYGFHYTYPGCGVYGE
jgi:hypothetical protein